MSSLFIACVMFACVLVSTLVAMRLSQRIPDNHLEGESRDVVKQGLGVLATLTALVLGLLVASTKGTYDAQSSTVKELAAQLGLLDRILARYGADAAEARPLLRKLAEAVHVQLWPNSKDGGPNLTGGPTKQVGENFFDLVASLEPKTDTQRLLKGRAQEITISLGQIRQRLVVNSERTIPLPLLVLLGVWQTALFAGFGLLAPRNSTTLTVLVICMLSVSGALYLVMELDRPFEGMVRVSDAPLRSVISHLGE